MPITVSNLTTGRQGTATSATTASLTLTSGQLYLMWVATIRASESVALPTVSGWTAITNVQDYAGGTRRLTVLKKDGDGSTGTHTIECAGSTQDEIKWIVDTWIDAGSASLQPVQSKTGAGPLLTMNNNIAAAENAITLAALAYSGGETITPEAGYTLLGRRQADVTAGIMSMYRLDADSAPPTPSYTMQFGGNNRAIALEIQAAAASGPTPTPAFGRYGVRSPSR